MANANALVDVVELIISAQTTITKMLPVAVGNNPSDVQRDAFMHIDNAIADLCVCYNKIAVSLDEPAWVEGFRPMFMIRKIDVCLEHLNTLVDMTIEAVNAIKQNENNDKSERKLEATMKKLARFVRIHTSAKHV